MFGMGEQNVAEAVDREELRRFTRALLDDIKALTKMLDDGHIETGIRRIGAEQEMFLIDPSGGPASKAVEVLERINDPRFTTELGRFNLEANCLPRVFGGSCLRDMEDELKEVKRIAGKAARAEGAEVLLVGILPTLQKSHLSLEHMTPKPRYFQLNKLMTELSGGEFRTLIKGMDELQLAHDNIMLEACNTSFQLHFQVAPAEFAPLYNLAQLVTAPVLAAAVNSPVLLRNRLWHETRIALFQQSVDVRSKAHQQRGRRTRVSFGKGWIDNSILEIFQEDISSFRVMLSTDLGEPSTKLLEQGIMPPLSALCLFNGTVYRWNRACYGVKDNVAHLRIENRVIPSGPTIPDEVANAAFYFGLMAGISAEHDDISKVLDFDVAKENFFAAARYGLQARFRWLDGQTMNADQLICEQLVPTAREGLKSHGVDSADIDKYMGIIEERVTSGRTGARWMLDSLAALGDQGRPEERYRAMTGAMFRRQRRGRPVHTWRLARFDELADWRQSFRRVGQVMTRNARTVHPEDVIDLAASLMNWERIRHLPVEDDDGQLVGIITHRTILRLFTSGKLDADEPLSVREVMHPDPYTVLPSTSTLEAIGMMRDHNIGALPVVDEDGRLVGIVTERDFIEISRKLLEASLREMEEEDANGSAGLTTSASLRKPSSR